MKGMKMEIETLEALKEMQDGSRVRLTPNALNPLHNKPVNATYSGGYFHCEGSDPMDGPDYYWADVFQYNERIEVIS